MLKEFNGHKRGYPDSKDKLRFHLVGRLEIGSNSYESNLVLPNTTRYQDSDSNLYVAYSISRPQAECTTTRNPQEGVHSTLQIRFGRLFTPQWGGL
jgi:hypothetical protein